MGIGSRSSPALPVILLALALAGCGVNNAGDPVGPTRQLIGPAPPGSHADVYCYPITNEEPVTQECEVILQADGDASEQQAVAWWYHAADALRSRMGTPFPTGTSISSTRRSS